MARDDKRIAIYGYIFIVAIRVRTQLYYVFHFFLLILLSPSLYIKCKGSPCRVAAGAMYSMNA